MADNVDITPGAGATVATDDVGGVHFQRMKLVASADGESEPYGDDDMGSARSLWVSSRIRSGHQEQASSGLTIAATNYAANDVVGAGWTFTNMSSSASGMGRITGIRCVDKADVLTGLVFYFASASITFGTDNAAPSVSDTDTEKIIATTTLGFVDLGGVRVGMLDSVRIPYFCDATSLFVYAVTPVANNFFAAVTDLPLLLMYELD